MKAVKIPKSKKKNFSSFNAIAAYKQLGITTLVPWVFESKAIAPSDFFKQRLDRLQRHFDLRSYEESKKLLIDAFCEEAMEDIHSLKIWKGARLESDVLIGNADYLIAAKKDYLEAPFACIVEAKKDDFEQGLAQCLVEMQACQWGNRQIGKEIDIMGIITNAQSWMFYKLSLDGQVFESSVYSLGDPPVLLGGLHYIFQTCEKNLN
ncbi:hypothetical protein [Pseudanabaena sp. PCC 6802]|uniref:hypothetical protein n=1 Tax=Pseudanabaena sp. PCC 6802 TaxID=118173 RepID=UPI0003474BCE|nr:hypothetical protein [Pseudanabaena sp. PCC 6802]